MSRLNSCSAFLIAALLLLPNLAIAEEQNPAVQAVMAGLKVKEAAPKAIEVLEAAQIVTVRYRHPDPIADLSAASKFAYSIEASGVMPATHRIGGSIYSEIEVVFSRHWGEAKDRTAGQWLEQMQRPLTAGYRLTDMQLVATPDRATMRKAFLLSQAAVKKLRAELSMRIDYKQLEDFKTDVRFDEGAWAESGWPRYPSLSYSHDVGKETKSGRAHLSEDWCALYFSIGPITGNPSQVIRPTLDLPDLGIQATWHIESANAELNKVYAELVKDALKDLAAHD